MNTWVVFFNPKDAPGKYVVRMFIGAIPTAQVSFHYTLEEARQAVPPDLIMFARDPRDDPSVVEVWL